MKTKTRTKIYLAKSNRSNPTDVSRVRTMLETLDVEVVEFTGGEYSNKPLMSCDYLVVVPDLSSKQTNKKFDRYFNHSNESSVTVGKGIYTQICDFNGENYYTYDKTFIIDNTDDIVNYGYFNNIEINNFQDYVNFAILNYGGSYSLIDNLKRHGIKTKNEVLMETKDEANYMTYFDDDAVKDLMGKIIDFDSDEYDFEDEEIGTQVKEEANKVMGIKRKSIDSSPYSSRSRRYLLIKNLRK